MFWRRLCEIFKAVLLDIGNVLEITMLITPILVLAS